MAVELCAVPLFVVVTAVLRLPLGRGGAAAVAGVGWRWFRKGSPHGRRGRVGDTALLSLQR